MESELRQNQRQHGREAPPQKCLVDEVIEPLREVPEAHIEREQRKKDLRPPSSPAKQHRQRDDHRERAAKQRRPRPQVHREIHLPKPSATKKKASEATP